MDNLAYAHDTGAQVVIFSGSQNQYEYGDESHCRRPVALKHNGSLLHRDSLNVASAKARKAFASTLNGRADVVLAELLVLSEVLEKELDEESESSERQPSQATKLVALVKADGDELFHDPNGDAFATIKVNTHLETYRIREKGYRDSLARRFHQAFAAVPGSQAMQDAIGVLEGEARFAGDERSVYVRLAPHEEALYLYLADDNRRVVRITQSSWGVIPSSECPVRFRHPRGMLALPEPSPTGSLDDLRSFIHLEDPDDADDTDDDVFKLLIGCVIGVFNLIGGKPLLEILGEQGSGKTVLARILVMLIDPCSAPLRSTPKEEGDLLIAALNRLVVAFDNLSTVSESMSDALCRLSTGGGIGKRQLYTDADEVVLNAQRPCIITGITSIATNSDLLDRTITITLPRLDVDKRSTERVVTAEFEAAHPSILGGLLTAVSTALKNWDSVSLSRLPRLADFVTWVEAAAPALGWRPGEFLQAFEDSRRNADAIAIEALPIGPYLLAFMKDRENEWQGTASQLLEELNKLADDATKRDRDWPKRANRLSNQIKRLAPNLRQVGLNVGWQRAGASGALLIYLGHQRAHESETYDESSSASSVSSDHDHRADDPDATDDTDDVSTDFSNESANTKCCACGGPLPPGASYLCDACG